MVCVDDASTDDSLSILQSYAAVDERFVVLHLEQNQGQAFARNMALQQARGELVCFLDADDWFEPGALACAVEAFEANEGTDAVLFDVSMDYADHTETYTMPAFEVLSGDEAFRMSLTWQIHGVYMVRTSIHLLPARPIATTIPPDCISLPLDRCVAVRVSIIIGSTPHR